MKVTSREYKVSDKKRFMFSASFESDERNFNGDSRQARVAHGDTKIEAARDLARKLREVPAFES